MRITLVTGGARSGKSHYAERRAVEMGGSEVTYVATATADDAEMSARIARHRASRPQTWRTVEVRQGVGASVREAPTAVVLVDCLTLLASNAFLGAISRDGEADAAAEDAGTRAVAAEVDDLLGVAAERDGVLLVVTNEIGLGVVPPTPLGRWFRDALGIANRRVAAAADEVVLMVSGIAVVIKGVTPHEAGAP